MQKNQGLIDEGINLLWKGFSENPNSNYSFRKLVNSLQRYGRAADMVKAAKMFGEYKVNRSDPYYQQIMGIRNGK